MSEHKKNDLGPAETTLPAQLVVSGEDRFNEKHPLGFTLIKFKVATQDTGGGLFMIEHGNLTRGGPPRHLHHDQDEWFYVLEGEVLIEVGHEKMRMKAGDSLLAPRKVPHAWAYVGEKPGRMLVAFAPAGKMEAFFREITDSQNVPQDTALFSAHGMELVGPPLT
ncbi:MAG TPA: cupin domain-containing protein [Candidatus Saccharimonadales bacterium]|jgi:mannose-6-phosphate isomerase-like protein (cupin superfamily)|nr:cupin domain-containing protein [Candidatus Saccharimonadales bacterium]